MVVRIYTLTLLVNIFNGKNFRDGANILAGLVHPQEQSHEMKIESSIDCMRRAVWGMLYTDDHTKTSHQLLKHLHGNRQTVKCMLETVRYLFDETNGPLDLNIHIHMGNAEVIEAL